MKKIILCLCILFSCTAKIDSPEYALREFTDKRFNKMIDKKNIANYVSGKLLEEISSMTNDEFSLYNELDDLRKKRFKISNKRCEKNKCYITYIISYETVRDEKIEFKTETKKIAEVIKTQDGWRVAEVTHLKTYHDSKQSL